MLGQKHPASKSSGEMTSKLYRTQRHLVFSSLGLTALILAVLFLPASIFDIWFNSPKRQFLRDLILNIALLVIGIPLGLFAEHNIQRLYAYSQQLELVRLILDDLLTNQGITANLIKQCKKESIQAYLRLNTTMLEGNLPLLTDKLGDLGLIVPINRALVCMHEINNALTAKNFPPIVSMSELGGALWHQFSIVTRR